MVDVKLGLHTNSEAVKSYNKILGHCPQASNQPGEVCKNIIFLSGMGKNLSNGKPRI